MFNGELYNNKNDIYPAGNDMPRNIISDNNTMVTIIHDNNRTNTVESITDDNNKTTTKDDRDDSYNYKNNVNIYRYKFLENITNLLYSFSKIHQYDDRKTFKESWDIWIEDNKEIIDYEVRRLQELHYEGDIIDKMFKSARYYFRKKSTEKKEPIKRRNYIGSQKNFLDLIDKHISSNIISNSNFKPSNGFNDFCLESENEDILNEEIKRLKTMDIKDVNEIKNKIKKTYKNRYFILIRKNN